MDVFNKLFEKFKISHSGNIDFIVAGLGNPGTKYENTRHNMGFMSVDYICKKNNTNLDLNKFCGIYGIDNFDSAKVLFLKPQTYMNKSGECVSKIMSYYKVLPEKVILIFDDVSLPLGEIKIKRKGTHGGHNGVRNILDLSASIDFPRIKVGIGEKPNENWDLADWVLSKFSNDEMKTIEKIMVNVENSLRLIINGNIERAMSDYN